MVKLFVVSYANKNARYAQSRAETGGVVILPAVDKMNACLAAERMLPDALMGGVQEAACVFSQDEDIQIEIPLRERSA
jgi:hypothetical protein